VAQLLDEDPEVHGVILARRGRRRQAGRKNLPEAFALVNTAMLGNGYWQYYMTLLTAPAEIFRQALPLMTEVWQSWSISQGEMNRRTAQAMLTMQEPNRIMQSTAEGQRTT
jgi:hypothetical protein